MKTALEKFYGFKNNAYLKSNLGTDQSTYKGTDPITHL